MLTTLTGAWNDEPRGERDKHSAHRPEHQQPAQVLAAPGLGQKLAEIREHDGNRTADPEMTVSCSMMNKKTFFGDID